MDGSPATGRRSVDCDSPVAMIGPNRLPSLGHACRSGTTLELSTWSRDGRYGSTRTTTVDPDERVGLMRTDDSTVVIAGPYRLRSVAMTRGDTRTLFVPPTGRRILPSSVGASLDGNWVAVASIPQDTSASIVHLVPLRTGTSRSFALPREPLGTIYWDPRQRYLVYLEQEQGNGFPFHAMLRPLNGDPAYALTRSETTGIKLCCWIAPDGGVVYTTVVGGAASLWTENLTSIRATIEGTPP